MITVIATYAPAFAQILNFHSTFRILQGNWTGGMCGKHRNTATVPGKRVANTVESHSAGIKASFKAHL